MQEKNNFVRKVSTEIQYKLHYLCSSRKEIEKRLKLFFSCTSACPFPGCAASARKLGRARVRTWQWEEPKSGHKSGLGSSNLEHLV